VALMEGNGSPTLWLIGGANGVGKTTFALARIEAVSGVRQFVNLDLIAKGLAPLDPELMKLRAGRFALMRVLHWNPPCPGGRILR
jgi:predicted ABC-type ATPase